MGLKRKTHRGWIQISESRTRGVARIALGLKPSRDSRATSQRDSPIWIQPLGVFRHRINGWVNNREAGDLRRYRAHYDRIAMDHSLPMQWESDKIASWQTRYKVRSFESLWPRHPYCDDNVKFAQNRECYDDCTYQMHDIFNRTDPCESNPAPAFTNTRGVYVTVYHWLGARDQTVCPEFVLLLSIKIERPTGPVTHRVH